jgi:hypothetical protein
MGAGCWKGVEESVLEGFNWQNWRKGNGRLAYMSMGPALRQIKHSLKPLVRGNVGLCGQAIMWGTDEPLPQGIPDLTGVGREPIASNQFWFVALGFQTAT